jgi:hypothetical protein
LRSFWSTGAKNPFARSLRKPNVSSSLSDEAGHAAPTPSPLRLRASERWERAFALGESADRPCRGRTTPRRNLEPAGEACLPATFDP